MIMLSDLKELIEHNKFIDSDPIPLDNLTTIAKSIVLDEMVSKFEIADVWKTEDSEYNICISYKPIDITIQFYKNLYTLRIDVNVINDLIGYYGDQEFNDSQIISTIKEYLS